MFGWLWVASVPTSYTGIAARYDAGDLGTTSSVSFAFWPTSQLRGWFSNGATDYSSFISGGFPAGQWSLVMIQRRADKLVTILNNSIFGNEVDVSGKVPNNGGSIYFGSMGQYFMLNGRIQDFGWIKGASLTDEEMAWLYNDGAGRTYADIVAAAG